MTTNINIPYWFNDNDVFEWLKHQFTYNDLLELLDELTNMHINAHEDMTQKDMRVLNILRSKLLRQRGDRQKGGYIPYAPQQYNNRIAREPISVPWLTSLF